MARMTDEEFERYSAYWTHYPLLEEARRARGREEEAEHNVAVLREGQAVAVARVAALEAALREIAHPKRGTDGYLDGCPGCIALAALDAGKP
jgi:hypothetical protein